MKPYLVLAMKASSNCPSRSRDQNLVKFGVKTSKFGAGGGAGRMGERNGMYWDGQGAVREEPAQVILPQGELCPPKVE